MKKCLFVKCLLEFKTLKIVTGVVHVNHQTCCFVCVAQQKYTGNSSQSCIN